MFIQKVLAAAAKHQAGASVFELLRLVKPVQNGTGTIFELTSLKRIVFHTLASYFQTKTNCDNKPSNLNNGDSSGEDDSEDEEDHKQAHDEVSDL